MSSTLLSDYDAFRDNWLQETLADASTSTEKGRAFSVKIIRQFLDLGDDEDSDTLFYCDGAGDGGIDLAFLKRAEEIGGNDESEGDTWYLVQSKYGKAFQGANTLLTEGRKVFETLQGDRPQLSSVSEDVLERLRAFLGRRGERDRLVLLFATVDPLSDMEKAALEDVSAIGRDRLKFNIEVDSVSLRTIFERTLEDNEAPPDGSVCVSLPVEMPIAEGEAQLLVGTVTLPAIYQFLSDYKKARGDLEVLYARNVRVFLGGKGKVNKGIARTLDEEPEHFGFYNNGITIVVRDFKSLGDGLLEVCDPAIVNGCQTTRSIWEVFEKKTQSGGTGQDRALADWKARVYRGSAIVKIVRVGENGSSDLLPKITRFTNLQNAVKDQDFLSLEADFRTWQTELKQHRIYLEVQRGGSDAQKAKQKKKTKTEYDEFVNAFDLFKIYGAGWLGEPGQAWNKNAAFLPKGEFFNEIVKPPFGAADLLECFYLQNAASDRLFGNRGKDAPLTRRLTRYLFYFLALELLRNLLSRAGLSTGRANQTRALRALRESEGQEWKILLDEATGIVDSYMNQGSNQSIDKDPLFQEQFGRNLNAYLKSDKFARERGFSPNLWHYLDIMQFILSRPGSDGVSVEERIQSVLKRV